MAVIFSSLEDFIHIQVALRGSRQAILDLWSADESRMIPHGRVLLEGRYLRVGIEPLGAGVTVALQYEHVPAFVMHLESAAMGLRR